ncbi:hypothetical protein GOBAR_AA07857 [Gossypium barbadense]|uniref:Uncharacterized protein n=1 Tax=Gossypium barbadense TaxID=3634 RepID=A0A2P5YB65_GOSBA|nr:hypothetical protein GOBAR_AA07857 [Gossypium barbadense]
MTRAIGKPPYRKSDVRLRGCSSARNGRAGPERGTRRNQAQDITKTRDQWDNAKNAGSTLYHAASPLEGSKRASVEGSMVPEVNKKNARLLAILTSRQKDSFRNTIQLSMTKQLDMSRCNTEYLHVWEKNNILARKKKRNGVHGYIFGDTKQKSGTINKGTTTERAR